MRGLGLGLGLLWPVTSDGSTPPPVDYPLDDIDVQPEMAYSLRKLRSSYDGPAVKVRTDGGYMVVGFLEDGTLDVEHLMDLVSTSDGDWATVMTWYDQSGNGNDAETAGEGSEPFIVQNGELCRFPLGQPAIFFDRDELAPGGTARLVSLSGEVIAATLTAFTWATCEDFANTYVGGVCATRLDDGADWNTTGACVLMQGIVTAADLGGYWANPQVGVTNDSHDPHLFVCLTSGSDLTYTIDGESSTGLTISGDYSTLSLVRWYIGDRAGTGGQWQGRFGEVIIYGNTLDSDDRATLSNAINAYWNAIAGG